MEKESAAALGGTATDEIDWGGENLAVDQILDLKILRVDEVRPGYVGYKSEGTIPPTSGRNGKNRASSATL